MKIIYFGSTFSSDADFPLIRALQKQGVEVFSYFTLSPWNMKKGIIEAEEMAHKDAILKAADVKAFAKYADYLDLDNMFVINLFHYKRYHWQSWIMWHKVLKHMKKHNADIFQMAWPLAKGEKVLYNLRCKKVLTLHDPFPHSSQISKSGEAYRLKAFAKSDSIILLSNAHKDRFATEYSIDHSRIYMAKLGEYDFYADIKTSREGLPEKFVLFFGQVQDHKGIDILVEAMRKTHESHPDVKLIVAGKGKYNFNAPEYEQLGYYDFRNRYIPVPELAALLQHCLFAVCPYKDATQSGVVQTAFSAEVPLIVTKVGALPESVTNGVNGLVVEPNDPQGLSEAMNKLLDNPELTAEFKRNIRDQWLPSMSWGPIAEKYIECYNSLL